MSLAAKCEKVGFAGIKWTTPNSGNSVARGDLRWLGLGKGPTESIRDILELSSGV